jgi:hypothetical protein
VNSPYSSSPLVHYICRYYVQSSPIHRPPRPRSVRTRQAVTPLPPPSLSHIEDIGKDKGKTKGKGLCGLSPAAPISRNSRQDQAVQRRACELPGVQAVRRSGSQAVSRSEARAAAEPRFRCRHCGFRRARRDTDQAGPPSSFLLSMPAPSTGGLPLDNLASRARREKNRFYHRPAAKPALTVPPFLSFPSLRSLPFPPRTHTASAGSSRAQGNGA